jgi:hypothetical protein
MLYIQAVGVVPSLSSQALSPRLRKVAQYAICLWCLFAKGYVET